MYIGLGYVTNKLIEYALNSALLFTAQIEEVRKGGRNFVLIIFVICGGRRREKVLFEFPILLRSSSGVAKFEEYKSTFREQQKKVISSTLCV